MERRVSGNSHARCGAGENLEITSKGYLSLFTLVLRYEYGKLKQAITRGREGIIGEDVTHTVRTFRNVPLTIPTKESFEVRGEGVISWESFHRINASLEEPYTHPRNLASGSTRKLDAGEASKRRLAVLLLRLNFHRRRKGFSALSKDTPPFQ